MKKYFIFIICLLIFICIDNVYAVECVEFENGNGTENNPYIITTPIELYSMSCKAEENKYFKLGNDIDLTYDTTNSNGLFYNNGKGWITINKTFTGYLDGNNKKIIGLTQNFDNEEGTNIIGFIYEIYNSNIKNLTFKNINIKVYKHVNDNSGPNTYGGGLAEYISNSNLDNVTLDGNININYDNASSPFINGYIGGFSYHIGNSKINNCINKINIESNLHGEYGGLSGKSSANEINNFINYGNIKANKINNIVDYYVGGIFGWADGYVKINNSKNYGEILGKDATGFVAYANKRLEINKSINYGNIYVVGSSGGGLVGTAKDIYITESINKGNINVSSGKYQGGYIEGVGSIAGYAKGKIEDVFNLGKIKINSCNVNINIGGIVGYLEGKLINSYNIGKVDLSNFDMNADYYKSDNSSPQTSGTFITGAVVGGSSSNSTIDNFYYLKDTIPILIYGRNKVHYIGSQSDIPLTLDQMLDKSTYQEFDFNNKWYINSSNGYMFPQLRNVELEGNYISKVNILNNDSEININNNLELKASVLPNNSQVTWSIIEGNDIVDLNNNILRFKDTGIVKVRATSKDFDVMYDEKEFNIVNKLINNISFNKSNINLKIGNSERLTVTYIPSDASNKSIKWKSSNENIATVDSNGLVTAKGVGNTIISASTLDGSNITVNCNVTVTDKQSTMFNDVYTSDWYYDAVKYVYDNKIIKGYTNGNFGPNDNLTRAMLVTILHRIEKEPSVTTSNNFSDVGSSWYTNAINWASDKKIVMGYGDGTFKPNNKITRQDLMVILYRYAKYKGKNMSVNTDITNYPDYNKIDNYAKEAMKWAIGKKILYGNKDGLLDPKGYATRAQVAAIIERYMKNI